MPQSDQRGIAHLFVIFIMVLGIALAVWLIGTKTNLLPHASESLSGPISQPVGSPSPLVTMTPTPVVTSTPTPNPNLDSDGDKFTDGQETFMGTNPQKACSTNGDDAWPIDTNNDTVINGADISTLAPYIQGTKAYNKRYDLDQNGKIDLFDANIIQPNMLKTCGPQPSTTPTPTPVVTMTPSFTPTPTPKKAVFGDWTGDGKADFAYYRPSTTGWFVKARELATTGQGWGAPTDIPVMGDYNGDGKMDKAVYRPSIATWYIDNEDPNGTKLGNPNDIPVPADYNGDGKTDKAVYQANGQWLTSVGSIGWGRPGNAIPVPADYNGDGKAEPAWFSPSDGKWFIQSNPSYVPSWGAPGDIPVPADYNGDGKAEIAVYRPSNGTWYVGAAGYSIYGYGWGASEDIPVPADYAGEGKARFAVFRPSNGTWYVFPNAQFSIFGTTWGQKGDIPTIKRPTFPAYPF